MGDFLTFRKFITPIFIQVIFWAGVAACVILGLIVMVSAGQSTGGTLVGILVGLLIIVLGPFFVRIYCELAIIFFRMHDRMASIDDKTR